jgi:putative nucleotidyltransferase with HDIG domain
MDENLAGTLLRQRVFFGLLVLTSAALIFVALLSPLLKNRSEPLLIEGQIAGRDYRSPAELTYTSQVITTQRQDAAERAVAPIYTAPDTRVARRQLEQLRTVLAYISSVRADSFATPDQKLDDLAAIEDLHLRRETAEAILGLTESRWQAVQQEAIVVLERVMGSTIRTEGVQDARNRLPVLVSLSLSESQAEIVAELAAAFVAANSQYSDSQTLAARQEARQKVEPVSVTYEPGQTVALRGEVLTAADIEALQQLGLTRIEQRWQDYASAALLTVLVVAFMYFYIRRRRIVLMREARSLTLITLLFLVFLLAARLMIPNSTVVSFAFPLAAYSLTVALFGPELALVSSLPLAILSAYGLSNSLELTLYYLVGSLFGVLGLGQARRLTSFFWAGAAVAVAGTFIILVYHLPLSDIETSQLATLAGAALFNGLASASLAVLLQFTLAQFLGMTTPMQLIDLTRPDHPLLRILLREAPGTYQHSLQVSNLAEQAAERIGADAVLTRVGALYHDVGKTINPGFFIENQVPGLTNPHEGLKPEESARIIIRHIPDGIELGRRYRLPQRVLDFISEHHGTMIARFQYSLALEAAGGDKSQVDEELYRYPGPKPRSRETAILMLADGSEARVRAERPDDEEGVLKVVKEVIANRMSLGQLDDTRLTLHDLNEIAESFTVTLRGVYHPRLVYPKIDSASQDTPTRPRPQAPAEQDNSVSDLQPRKNIEQVEPSP